MEIVNDRRSRLREAYRQLERAEVYVVAARELLGADSRAGRRVEGLRQQLLAVAESLREERREQAPRPRRMRAIGG